MSSVLISVLMLVPHCQETKASADTEAAKSEQTSATQTTTDVIDPNTAETTAGASGPDIAQATKTDESQTTAEASEYQLRYKFRKGDIAHYEVNQKIVRTSTTGPRKEVTKEAIYEKKRLVVTDTRPDGSFLVQTVFDHVKMAAMFGSKVTMQFDSSKPKSSDPPGFAAARKSIENPEFRVWFKPTGAQERVVRLDRNGEEKAEDKRDESNKGKAAEDRSAKEKAAKDADGSGFLLIFPDRPLKVGDTWRREYTVKVQISKDIKRRITILRTYRLNSVEDGIADISFASSLKTPVVRPDTLAQLAQTRPSGKVKFHINSGRIVSRSLRIEDTVLNHAGPKSMLHTTLKRTEQQIAPPAADSKTARRD